MSDYSQTYWSNKGKHGAINTLLEKMIPESGSVSNPKKNRKLETFRIASNCYYDLYNNGLCNRARAFARVFGFGGKALMAGKLRTGGLSLTQTLIDRTESKMDEIILAAYAEQSCGQKISTDGTQYGHWIGNKFNPCNKLHPGQLVQDCARRLIGK